MLRHTLRGLLHAGVLAGGAYLLALLGVSLASRDRTLVPGDTQRFCGLYLDCHRTATVLGVEHADSLGGLHAAGTFHVVTVRLANDARRATLALGRFDARMRDASGRTYPRATAVEAALAAAGIATGLPNRRLGPGEALVTRLVFDLPTTTAGPRLRLWDADPTAAVTEFLLIGDDDSLLHGRTWFALPSTTDTARATSPAVRLCGVGSGCDTLVRVVDVRRDSRAGRPPGRVPADGVFYTVTVSVADADSGAPVRMPLIAEVRDARGRSYARAWDVERLAPVGGTRPGTVRMVFDLPDRVVEPRLVLRRPGLLNRIRDGASLPLVAAVGTG